MGVTGDDRKFTVDITAAVNLTVGSGNGTSLNSYTINNNSPIPNKNNFKNSISYGQFLTWNSNINENKFSIKDIQRQGMIGFRLGNVNVSSNNDTTRFYGGEGTDWNWTGGLYIDTPVISVGYQNYSGKYQLDAKVERQLDDLKRQIKDIGKSKLSKEEKKEKIAVLDKELTELTDKNLHTQTEFQKNLNKASTYFKLNYNGNSASVEFIGEAWLQNSIHKQIKDLRFEYGHQKTELWVGRSF